MRYFFQLAGFYAMFNGAASIYGTSLNAIFCSQDRRVVLQYFAV